MLSLFLSSLSANSNPPAYVWSLGFCVAADVHPEFGPKQNAKEVENLLIYDEQKYLENIKDGSIVWVHGEKLSWFIHKIIPKIGSKIILVLGGTDLTFPKDYKMDQEINDLINSPKILHLFMQNCEALHPKITQIPIGLDLHASFYWPERFGEKEDMTPKDQLVQINEIVKTLAPTGERKLHAICDFGHNDSMRGVNKRYLDFGEDRTSIRKKVDQMEFATHLKGRVLRKELWKMKGACAFDISPPGNGVDCYRTWESLVLGCIVIVKDSFLNPLFEGLPVITVKSWDEITKEKLIAWQDKYSDALTNPKYREKLHSMYWINKIRKKQYDYFLSTASAGSSLLADRVSIDNVPDRQRNELNSNAVTGPVR